MLHLPFLYVGWNDQWLSCISECAQEWIRKQWIWWIFHIHVSSSFPLVQTCTICCIESCPYVNILLHFVKKYYVSFLQSVQLLVMIEIFGYSHCAVCNVPSKNLMSTLYHIYKCIIFGAIAFLPSLWTSIVILPLFSLTLHSYPYCLHMKLPFTLTPWDASRKKQLKK